MSSDPAATADLMEAVRKLEKASSRARPFIILALISIVAGFVILSLHLDNMRDDAVALADRRGREANAVANTLEATRRALERGDQAEAARLLGVAIRQTEHVAESAVPVAGASDEPAPLPAAAPKIVTAAVQQAPAAKGESPAAKAAHAPRQATHRVYIQFAGSLARGRIVDLNQALRAAGWNVQGASGERIGTAAGLNEVRYGDEEDRALAEALAAAVTRVGVAPVPVAARQLDVIRPDTLELWISN